MIQYILRGRLYIWKKDDSKSNVELVDGDRNSSATNILNATKTHNLKDIENSLGFDDEE